MNIYQVGKDIRQVLEWYPDSLPPDKRGLLIASGIARGISLELPIPSAPLDNLHGHYLATHYQVVSDIVADINEHYVILVEETMKMVFQFYKIRYDVYHVEDNMFGLLTAVAASTANDSISPLVSELLQNETKAFDTSADYFYQWRAIVKDLTESIRTARADPESAPVAG